MPTLKRLLGWNTSKSVPKIYIAKLHTSLKSCSLFSSHPACSVLSLTVKALLPFISHLGVNKTRYEKLLHEFENTKFMHSRTNSKIHLKILSVSFSSSIKQQQLFSHMWNFKSTWSGTTGDKMMTLLAAPAVKVSDSKCTHDFHALLSSGHVFSIGQDEKPSLPSLLKYIIQRIEELRNGTDKISYTSSHSFLAIISKLVSQ